MHSNAACRQLIVIAGGQQHLQSRLQILRRFGQIVAGHAFRHHDVGEQKIEFIAGTQDGERRRPAFRRGHLVAEGDQVTLRCRPQHEVIVDHQDRFVASRIGMLRFACIVHRNGIIQRPRQIEPHRGADAHLAVDREMAARLHGEAVDHAEAEAGGDGRRLGGEEWFSRPLDHVGWHAGAGIGHRENNIVALRHFGVLGGIRRRQTRVGGLDREVAAMRHRIARIQCQIEQRIADLRRIGIGQPDVRRQLRRDMDLSSPMARVTKAIWLDSSAFRSMTRGCNGCLRANASRRRVSSAPLSALSRISRASSA